MGRNGKHHPVASLSKQITVCPGAGQRQHQHIVLNTVNQQPVREDMTFPMSHLIPGQRMVLVFLRKRFTHSESRNDILQQIDLQTTLDRQLVVLLELGSVLDSMRKSLTPSGAAAGHICGGSGAKRCLRARPRPPPRQPLGMSIAISCLHWNGSGQTCRRSSVKLCAK